jgi:TPR repeat
MKQTKATAVKKSTKEGPASDATRTLLHVDLWTDMPSYDRASARSGEINVLPSALAMVGDLITAVGGEFRESSTTSISASFSEPIQAVNAARRLQRLVTGFSRASGERPLYACFTITNLKEAEAESDPDPGLLSCIDTVKQAQSGEVLFIGGICETARSIPGLQFKTPAGAPLSKRPDQPSPILQLLPPEHMEGFVNEPAEPPRKEQRLPLTTASSAIPDQPITSLPAAAVQKNPAPAVIPQIAATSAESIPSAIPDSLSLKIKPVWAIIGVSSVAVLATILIFGPIFKSSPKPANQPLHTSGAPTGATTSTNPTPSPAPPPAQPSGAIKSEPTKAAAKPNEPARTHPGKETATEEPKPPVPRGGHTVTFNQQEIDILIARADKDTGDGKYDRAIEEYNTVLSQDPSNALARRGLAKALHNKGQN